MKIIFCLEWLKAKDSVSRGFKSSNSFGLFSDYTNRINKFTQCQVIGTSLAAVPKQITVWLCDRGTGSKILSSEDIARQMERLQDTAVKELRIYVGGPAGFASERLELLKPDIKWCFGAMTLPHELAAVIAAEQIYRSWTILKNLPYHKAH